jgi:cytochrome c-type biogenesis protein CcmE
MKKSHIIAIVILAVTMGFIISTVYNTSTYGNFSEAFSNVGDKYTVVGHINKEESITSNPNLLEFYMYDKDSVEHKVMLNQSKPQDFERAESVVITGKAKDDGVFYATDIQMKCPSKYNDKQ